MLKQVTEANGTASKRNHVVLFVLPHPEQKTAEFPIRPCSLKGWWTLCSKVTGRQTDWSDGFRALWMNSARSGLKQALNVEEKHKELKQKHENQRNQSAKVLSVKQKQGKGTRYKKFQNQNVLKQEKGLWNSPLQVLLRPENRQRTSQHTSNSTKMKAPTNISFHISKHVQE